MKSGVILRKIILSHGKLVKRGTGKGHFRINLSMDEFWMNIAVDEYRFGWVSLSGICIQVSYFDTNAYAQEEYKFDRTVPLRKKQQWQ